MPQLISQQPPPADYYADNLRGLLREVETRSGELLGDDERRFIAAWHGCGVSAQRLFARLLTRKGPWIRVDSLNYAEVADRGGALDALQAAGLARWCPLAPADALLARLTRREQAELFPSVRAAAKARWIEACVARYPDAAVRARVARRYPWVAVAVTARQALRVCLLLFFGDERQDLTTFVMQDLGIQRFENYPLGPDTRPFADRGEVQRYLRCRELGALYHRADEAPGLPAVIRADLWPPARSRSEQRLRDRLLNRLGRDHERRGELDAALECFARSTSHPARERRARILRRLGDAEAVRALLDAMAADPWCPEEEDFAARFGNGHARSGREAAAAAPSVHTLEGDTPPRIEQHALELLTGGGGHGWHLENGLPLGLAGLAYWDQVFAPVRGAFSHPFQAGPRDLFWADFARNRRTALLEQQQRLAAPGGFASELERVFESRRGVTNQLVSWSVWEAQLLERLLADVPHGLLLRLASFVIVNLHRLRTGFPDLLLIYGPGAFEVVEVKGPTDQLQSTQRVWLRTLEQLAIPARVLKFKRSC